jgi:hypothetical protein
MPADHVADDLSCPALHFLYLSEMDGSVPNGLEAEGK